MSKIKLTVIIAAFNVEHYIEDCMRSFCDLNELIELIIIDDGSNDETLSIIKEKTNNMSVRVITQSNKGISCVRNIGIKKARGEFVTFIDGDDFIDLKKLLNLLLRAEENDSEIVFGNFCNYTDLSKNIINNNRITEYINMSGIDVLEKYYLKEITPSVWKAIYKKDFLIENDLFFLNHVSVAEDFEWLFRVLYQAKKVTAKNEYYYFYRLRPGSVMRSTFSENNYNDILRVVSSLIEFTHSKFHSQNSQLRFNEQIFAVFLRGISMYRGKKNPDKIKTFLKKLKTDKLKFRIVIILVGLCPNLISNILYFKYVNK